MYKIINLQQDKGKKQAYISSTLETEILKTLEKWEKILLYLNKRGFHSAMICNDCSYAFSCARCNLQLKVHEKLRCHFCGYSEEIPLTCKECQGNNLQKVGIWTKQISDFLYQNFQQANIYRFDTDSIKTLQDKKAAIQEIEKADIIVGTKMMTTGFNIPKIGLIWIILLESELGMPFFDAEEQVYTRVTQMIGRGNRKNQHSNIIIQTFLPDSQIVEHITQKNYKDFLSTTLQDRKLLKLPPYGQIATLEYRDKNKEKIDTFLEKIHTKLQAENETPEEKKEIIFLAEYSQRYNYFSRKIIIRGTNIRFFLEIIKKDIVSNKQLSLTIE